VFPVDVTEKSLLEENAREGESPVGALQHVHIRSIFVESRFLGVKRKVGGKLHLRLNSYGKPIAKKYLEGKMKRTLERELKFPEIAEKEAVEM
jgi:hypothetical protein